MKLKKMWSLISCINICKSDDNDPPLVFQSFIKAISKQSHRSIENSYKQVIIKLKRNLRLVWGKHVKDNKNTHTQTQTH